MGLNFKKKKPSQDMWNLTCAAKSQIDKTGGNSIVAAQCRRRWKLLILFFFFFLLYRILHAVTQHCDRGWNRTCVPIDLDPPLHFPPSPWNVVLHHRGLRPLLVTNQYWLWGLLRPTRIWTVKELWDGAYGFSSLSEKTKKDSNV